MKVKLNYHKNVILTGLTSFFTDISSEMIYPLIQAFISIIMRTQAQFLGPVLGVIEGISESTASLLRVISGYYSDKIKSRKLPTILGYLLSAISKLLFFIPIWWIILLARLSDRIGKGIRTAPRDALISESTPKEFQGKAFGFQRAMDFAGAFLGTILCLLIIKFIFPQANEMLNVNSFYPIFIIAIIPAFIAVIFLFFIKEERITEENFTNSKPKPNIDIRKYDRNLQIFFIAQFLFTLGNSSNQFLLLRSQKLGFSLVYVLLMYIIFNLSTALFSTFFGSLSDKKGKKLFLVIGYLLYSFIYVGFGFISQNTKYLLWIFWPIYGLYYALTEGVEKAFVSSLAPVDSKATALGFYNTIVGIGLLPASLIAGFLFSFSQSAPFLFGGFISLLSVIIILFFVKEKK